MIVKIIRGIGYLPGYGSHPGTKIVLILIALSTIAGARTGGLPGAIFGATIMTVTMGGIYLWGAYNRYRSYELALERKTNVELPVRQE